MTIIQFRLNGETTILTYQFNDVDTFDNFRNLFINHSEVLSRIDDFISDLDDEDLIYNEDYYDDLSDDFDVYLSDNGESLEYIELIKLN